MRISDPAPSSHGATHIHILVVEDNDGVRDVIAAALEAHGYRVSVCASGAAMRDLLNTGVSVDAVVLDSLLPGEAGPSLALHLKALRLPIVMISGNHDARPFAEEHALQLLGKPFRSAELVTALDKAIAAARQL